MLLICKQLFSAWTQLEVRYCHWKSNEHLEEGLDGKTDLDVFVALDDKVPCEEGLKSCSLIKFRPQASSRYPGVDEWLGFDPSTGAMIHVHLHFRLITGTKFCKEYEFPIGDLMLSTRIVDADTDVYVASPDLEIIILFARIALKAGKTGRVKLKSYRDEIVYLKERMDAAKVQSYCIQFLGEKDGASFFGQISDELETVDWKQVLALAKRWLNPYRTSFPLSCWFRSKYYWFRLYWDMFVNRLGGRVINKKTLPHKGLSVAFIGQDGSGKSTVSKDIFSWLNWKVAVHSFYLGTGDGYQSLLKSLLARASGKSRKPAEKQEPVHEAVSPHDANNDMTLRHLVGAVLTSWHLCCATSAALKKARQAFRYVRKGGIALFDRFPQDQFPGIYDGPKINSLYGESKRLGFLFRRLARREERNIRKMQQYAPELVFKLVLPPEESIRRKPFENVEMVKRKALITQELSFPKSTIYMIDATEEYASEIVRIKSKIWDSLKAL